MLVSASDVIFIAPWNRRARYIVVAMWMLFLIEGTMGQARKVGSKQHSPILANDNPIDEEDIDDNTRKLELMGSLLQEALFRRLFHINNHQALTPEETRLATHRHHSGTGPLILATQKILQRAVATDNAHYPGASGGQNTFVCQRHNGVCYKKDAVSGKKIYYGCNKHRSRCDPVLFS